MSQNREFSYSLSLSLSLSPSPSPLPTAGEENEKGMEPDVEEIASDPWEMLDKLPKALQEKLLEMRESRLASRFLLSLA